MATLALLALDLDLVLLAILVVGALLVLYAILGKFGGAAGGELAAGIAGGALVLVGLLGLVLAGVLI